MRTVIHIPRRYVESDWGGTETVIMKSSEALAAFGWHSEVYTSAALSVPGDGEVYGLKVRRFSYFYPRLGLKKEARKQLDMIGGNLLSLKLFWALITRRDLNAIHLHTLGFMGILARLAAKIRKIPYFITIHGGNLELPQSQKEKLAAPLAGSFNYGKILEILLGGRRVMADATAIFCVSHSEYELMRAQYSETKAVYLPNGVDVGRFSSGVAERFRARYCPPGDDRSIILSVGGFYPQKNQSMLLEAFARVHADRPDSLLVLIGVLYDRDYFAGLERRANELGIADSVMLIKNLPFNSESLEDAYAASSLFVMPSTYEPFGIVCIEAWAAGRVVLCSPVGGMRQFIQDGRNGLYFDLSSLDDLVAKITRLLGDDALRTRLAEAGRRDAEDYSWAAVAGKLAEYYPH